MNNSNKFTASSDSSPLAEGKQGLALLKGKRRARLQSIGVLSLDLWPSVDVLALSPKHQEIFNNRFRALYLYAEGHSLSEIRKVTGIVHQQLYALFDKCLVQHSDQRIYGFRALIPGIRIKRYSRRKPMEPELGEHHGGVGAFTQLLEQFPVLADHIYYKLFPKRSRKGLAERKISVKRLHASFLNECRMLGLAENHKYPFNTETLAYSSICRYVDELQKNNPELTALFRRDGDAVKRQVAGDGSDRPVLDLLDRVECDAHKIDAVFCILIPTSYGNLVPKIIRRLWVIVLIEVKSRVVLGYHLSLRKECNEEDLIRSIKNALSLWRPREGTIIPYDKDAGFPSSINPAYIGACWNELSMDGAKINHSQRIQIVLKNVVGAKTYLIPRRNPNDRPFVERFFKTLEDGSFHQLPNSVGGSPAARKGTSPELSAVKYFIQLDHLYDLLDVAISGYNATVHSSLGGRAPLEYFDHCARKSGLPIRTASPDEVAKIYAVRKQVRVAGSEKKCRKPYVEFLGARYTSDLLRSSYTMVGRDIAIEVNPQDPRVIKAYSMNGAELGVLRAAPPWGVLPHTLEMRQAYMRAVKLGKLPSSPHDAVSALLLHLEEAAVTGKEIPHLYLELRQLLIEREMDVRNAYASPQAFVTDEPTSLSGGMTSVRGTSLPKPRKAKIGEE